ncbi:hypothetical protein DSO57_1014940 [Entomophthora muscae]|uniref:Uncharacterized protein n=1 Tax=Entomophthora muscae TaxID=34485 RepID=A0ACC2SUX0_9FUNG|nr:hypothetical protein DSO57_1014940 [Entomophthora muscae]
MKISHFILLGLHPARDTMARYIRNQLFAPLHPSIGLQPCNRCSQPLRVASDGLAKEIKKYVDFSISSYCKADKISNVSLVNYSIDTSYTGNNVSIFYDQYNQEVIVGFPGADVYRKIVQYKVADKVSFDGVKGSFVDHKLYKLALKLFPLVKEIMAGISKKNQVETIVLVGHSTGGAVATLIANLFVKRLKLLPSWLRVITYNQPRVGNVKFAEDYHALKISTTRVVDPSDEMVHYPPEKDGWSHTGEEVHFDPNNESFYFSNSSFHEGADLDEFNEFLFYGYRHGLIGDRRVVYKRSWRNFRITIFC